MPAKKTLPGLEPINYVEVVNPTMLKKWLSNSAAKSAWQDAVYTVTELGDTQDTLESLPNKPTNYDKVDPIVLGKVIKEYVDLVLNDWTEDSTDETAKVLVASLPLFVEMSKTLPHVNPSDEYKFAFRGTSLSEKALKRFLKDNPDPKDWVQTTIGSLKYMAYKGPKKRMFTYKPRRQTQSWSTSEKAASRFGSHIVATALDLTFFFDPSFMNQYGFKWENETIHFGKEPMRVALLVDKNDYDEYIEYLNMTPAERRKLKDPSKATFESDYDQYMANQYTGGDKLLWKIQQQMIEKGKLSWYTDNSARLAKEKAALGKAEFKKKYTDFLYNLKASPVSENAKPILETVEVADEEGTLTMPL